MAKLKNNVDAEALKADIEAIKNSKNKEEVDQIKAKYNDALTEMNEAKAEETAPKKAPAKKAATTKKATPKKEEAKKEPAKKETTKKAAPKKEEAKKEEPKKETPKKETAKKEPAKKETTKKAAPAPVAAPIEKATDEKKERTYNGKYEISVFPEGASYRLKASNGQILVISELYTTRDGVLKAIEAVKKNLETGEITVFADKHGNHKFQLKAKNHRVLAISANYTTEKRAQSAVESFKRFAVSAEIVDIENPEDSDFKLSTPIAVNYSEDKQGGKFLVSNTNGDYSWDLKASNGQILCQDEGYTSKAGCLSAIESFKKYVVEGTFKCSKDKNNNYEFKLYSPSGRVITVGEAYPSKTSAESAAQSVVSFYKNAEIVEEEPAKKEPVKK